MRHKNLVLSFVSLFLASIFTSLLFANSVWSLNSVNLRSVAEPTNFDNSEIIAFQQSSSRQKYLQQLEEADRYYQKGDLANTLKIQKEVKEPFTNTGSGRRKPIDDPEKLSGGALSYYRNGKSGLEEGLVTKALIPLQRLSEDYPEFIPGHLMLAEAARKFSDENVKVTLKKPKIDVELEALERGSSLFPERKDLLDARIKAFASYEKFIEASVTARQFSVIFPNDPDSGKYRKLAEEYLAQYRRGIQEKIVGMATAGAVFGGLGSVIQIVGILSQSETDYGNQQAAQIINDKQLVADPEVLAYVNRVGQKIAKPMGRDDFQYGFYVYKEDDANVFTLPGGKVFLSTGLLNLIGTEAELAGLLGHEVGHAVLSHAYIKQVDQLLRGVVTNNIFGIGFLQQAQSNENSPLEEKQADILATRALATAGYSSDGLWNVMRLLKSAQSGGRSISYFTAHPPSSDRIAYLEEFINLNNFNRYAFEGVANFRDLQKRLQGDEPIASKSSTPTTNQPDTSAKPNAPVVNAAGCQAGKVPLAARIQRDMVTVSLDGAVVANSCSSVTVKLRIQNDSDRAFTFVPGFLKVLKGSGDELSSHLTLKNGQSTVQAGRAIEADLQVFKYRWSNDGKQDLILELKEGSTDARVFRVAF